MKRDNETTGAPMNLREARELAVPRIFTDTEALRERRREDERQAMEAIRAVLSLGRASGASTAQILADVRESLRPLRPSLLDLDEPLLEVDYADVSEGMTIDEIIEKWKGS